MSPIKTKRQECIVYSRVVGWLTPVSNWNKGKKAEFADRKTFVVDEKDFN
jgi:anaerobic ribonucleoside-triphosphate reductase